ncbi:MAG: MBL fold metallo-hydrolase [bacterium]|nr:MBL fold metallo-hydrolase [bacterium]
MQLGLLACESLGVRSLATYIKTPDTAILIDPGAAVAPERFGLPPARAELAALEEARQRIQEAGRQADIVVISHYHYDHHTPFFEDLYCSAKPEYARELYSGKILLIKHPEQAINRSQYERSQHFLLHAKNLARNIAYADNQEFVFGSTRIKFSPPVWHGPSGSPQGYVIMTLVEYGNTRILHASDVQGPVEEQAAEWIIEQQPDIIILGGPPTHFLGWRFSKKNLERAVNNVLRILDEAAPQVLVYEHHHLRDPKYKDRLKEVYEQPQVRTAAEFLGLENRLLEAKRKELHKQERQMGT